MNDEQLEEVVKELNEKIEVLETKNNEMINDLQKVESERRYIESELFRTQKELKRMKSELERMKSPPLIIGSIKDVLVDGRVIVKSSTGPDFIVTTSEYVPPEDLIVGSRVALNKQTLAVMNVLPPSLDPLVTGAEIIEKPELSYSEIGGLEEQIMEVREAVEDPLLRPELYKKVGIDPPKGVLLVGPPGTGKTLLAKAVAHQTNATFIRFVGSELVQKYIGEGARLVRELFELAKEKAPSIVFIDELDSIGAKRLEVSTSGDREVQRTLMQLLSELDGFNPIGEVKIIGATNRPDILDDALLRPGRFDRIIEVPVPNYDGRLEILKIHTRRMNMDENISLTEIALKADGATGAELKAICTEAGMFAIREGRDCVISTDFDHAISKILDIEAAKIVESGVMFA